MYHFGGNMQLSYVFFFRSLCQRLEHPLHPVQGVPLPSYDKLEQQMLADIEQENTVGRENGAGGNT